MTTQHQHGGNPKPDVLSVLEELKTKLQELSGRGSVPGHELKPLVTEIENAQAQHKS